LAIAKNPPFNYIWLMQRKLLITVLLSFLAGVFLGHNPGNGVVIPHVNPGLRFTENKGQWEKHILFRSQLDGGLMWMESNCLTFNFYDRKKLRAIHNAGFEKKLFHDYNIRSHGYKIHFENCNANIVVKKAQMGPDYENFYFGKDSSKWKSYVRNYHQIWYNNLYDGIDYEVISAVNGIKYNFHLKPNANAANIRLRYEGVENIKIRNGALELKLDVNEVIEQRPYAYQIIGGEIVEVACQYKLKNKVVTFEFPQGYDKNQTLVIDPLLVFSAQAGSTADNFGMTATFDASGHLYSGGVVYSAGYPYILGSYSNVFNGTPAYGNTDLFISKYNPTGTALIYSTYLGGNGTEVVSSLIVDKNNNLCLYGATGSTNFPVLPSAAYPNFAGGENLGFVSNGTVFFGGTDIFISKFNANGSALLASTYYGGSGNDGVNYLAAVFPVTFALAPAPGTATTNTSNYDSLLSNYGDTFRGEIQLDTLNNIYIVSSTRSSDIPMVGGFDNTLGGKQDAVIAKFNPGLTSLIYSSYLGGDNIESGNGLFVRPNFEVFVTGGTTSTNFPGTAGAQSPTYNGGITDGFLTRINAAGNAIIRSTYIGTSSYDNSFFVQCNAAGDPHVYGQSNGNMPVITPTNAITIYSVANTHQFITKYNIDLTTKLMSTVFGSNTSNFDISPSAFAVDECNGNIYLSGWGGNILTNIPVIGMPLLNPTQGTTTGFDFYMMALTQNAGSLLYGSYFGGSSSQEHVDGGTSRFDRKGVIYQSVCAGCGGNQDFPISNGAWPCSGFTPCPNPNPSGNCNNGVFKIDFEFQNTVATINTNTIQGCVPLTVNFNNVTPGTGFIWHFGNGQTNTVNPNPSVTFTAVGVYTVSLVVFDTLKCIKKDSAVTYITVKPLPISAFDAMVTPCSSTVNFVNNSTGTLAASPFIWNLGDGSPNQNVTTPPPHTYTANGNYTVSLLTTAANGCSAVSVQTLNIFIFNPQVSGGSVCYGQSTNVSASGGTSYTWSPASGLSSTSVASPAANPSVTTIYTVQIDNNTPGYVCSRTMTTQVTILPKPTAVFATTVNPCGGGVNFFDSSVSDISIWQWTLSANATSTLQNPYYFYANGGTHSVTLIVTNTSGCKDTLQRVITVNVPPPMSVNGNSVICLGSSAQLSSNGGVDYQWTPALSLNVANIPDPIASPTVSTQYSVVITTSNNCKFTLVTNVSVYQPPTSTAIAVANPTFVVSGNVTTLIYTGAPGLSVSWLPVGTTTPATGYTVVAAPIIPTTYTAIATNGPCIEKKSVLVEAYTEGCIDKDVFVPNTFTPNGDGLNDILFLRGLKIDEMYFAVYNRWGEMVFETKDKSKGWDGYYKGRPADVGVFGWYLKVKCFNGEETFKKGNVTLIR
jgi:gliding motility-associated-like protein